MEKFRAEHYARPARPRKPQPPPHERALKAILDPRPGFKELMFENSTALRFCNDAVPLDGPDGVYNNPNYMSSSQKLAGGPNPKSHIAPVIAPPATDLEYWRANNLVTHSAINAESQVEAFQSGYQVSTCCPPEMDGYVKPTPNPLDYMVPIQEEYQAKESFGHDHAYWRKPKTHPPSVPKGCKSQLYSTKTPGQNIEGFQYTYPFLKTAPPVEEAVVLPNQPGWVNTACGYNPEQLETAGLPTNLAAGNCPQDPVMKKYNDNLFTQTIQPGVYTRNEINEPINANMGISFTQQFEPTTCKTDPETGALNYIEHDPRIIEPAIVQPNVAVMTAATEANIYDPRFSGYGTSYRAYTDDNLGQTKFYYDDVDAIRMPNYITRNNIDHQPFADKYGPLPAGNANGNKWNAEIRALANDAFTSGAIEFRTDLQERLMRKVNSEAWQQRKAPIQTGGQRMLGGMTRIY